MKDEDLTRWIIETEQRWADVVGPATRFLRLDTPRALVELRRLLEEKRDAIEAGQAALAECDRVREELASLRLELMGRVNP